MSAVVDGTGRGDHALMRAAFPLAGGALDAGSTCGVVSGGCLGLALARADRLSSDSPADVENVYRELRGYTRWFESRFGSTLCRERVGADLSSVSGFKSLPVIGRMLTRCLTHAGRAVDHVAGVAGSVGVSGVDVTAPGLCAGPVLEVLKTEPGSGYTRLKAASAALDGGIGLSGGLCGALAAALMVIGEDMAIDPREAGLVGTLKASAEGISPRRGQDDRRDIFTLGGRVVDRFREEFGSLECRSITGRTFEDLGDIRSHFEDSGKCTDVMEWCRRECSSL